MDKIRTIRFDEKEMEIITKGMIVKMQSENMLCRFSDFVRSAATKEAERLIKGE